MTTPEPMDAEENTSPDVLPTGYNEETALDDMRGDKLWINPDDHIIRLVVRGGLPACFQIPDEITRDYLMRMLEQLKL